MNLVSKIDAGILARLVSAVPSKNKRQKGIVDAFAALLPDLLEGAGINTALRISHFLAQVAHESNGFRTTEEYASGKAYEGRVDLGNTKAGDGVRFKGRGPIQLTGRSNYRNFSLWMKKKVQSAPDFLLSPDLVAEFPWAAHAAIWFWTVESLNVLADSDNLVAVTKVINGGRNGLSQRAKLLAKAKSLIMPLAAHTVSQAQDGFAVLYRGSEGEDVDRLQTALAAAGYYLLAIDGDFGAGTELAVKAFQKAHGLTADGLAGRETFKALSPFIKD